MKAVIRPVAALLSLAVIGGCLLYNSLLPPADFYDKVQCYVLTRALCGEEAKELFEENELSKNRQEFVLFGEQKDGQIENEDYQRSMEASVIGIYGNSSLLYPYGYPLRPEDTGCLLGEAAAVELFGSAEVAGREIAYGGRSYKIRAVLPEEGSIFLFEAQKDMDVMLDRIAIAAPEDESQVFLAGRSLSGRRMPLYWHRFFEAVLFWLPVCLGFFGILLFPGLRYFGKKYAFRRRWYVLTLVMALFACLYLLGRAFHISLSHLPGQVSDMSAWISLLTGLKDDFYYFFQKGFYGPQLSCWRYAGALLRNSLPGYIFICIDKALSFFMLIGYNETRDMRQ